MECWPLGLLDKGKKGSLEDVDRIQVREEKGPQGKEKCVITVSAKPRDYFSRGTGNKSPMDRLKELVEAEPQIRTVTPELLRYIFDEQREWLRNNVGH